MQREVPPLPLLPDHKGGGGEGDVLRLLPLLLEVVDLLVELRHTTVDYTPDSRRVRYVCCSGWRVYRHKHQHGLIRESWNLHDLFPVLDLGDPNVEESAGDFVDMGPIISDQSDDHQDVPQDVIDVGETFIHRLVSP